MRPGSGICVQPRDTWGQGVEDQSAKQGHGHDEVSSGGARVVFVLGSFEQAPLQGGIGGSRPGSHRGHRPPGGNRGQEVIGQVKIGVLDSNPSETAVLG